jgi:S1-C subfamily serine protease
MYQRTLLAAALLLAPVALCAQSPAPQREGRVVRPAGSPRVPYTGMHLRFRPVFTAGAMRFAEHPEVLTVDAGSPAARVGVRPGDVVLAVDGTDGRDPEALAGPTGRTFVLRMRRGTQVREVTLTSEAAPSRAGHGG